MLNITSGKINRPQKVVIYGSEGIGKTTLASKFPDPLFIDTEGSTIHLDVRRVDPPATWETLLNDVCEVSVSDDICKTLVIDTADWAEQLAIDHVCKKYKKDGIESFGYSKGYVFLSEEFSKLLTDLDLVIGAGMNVVITAHAKMRKFEQPDEMGAYDRWEMKLSKNVAPLLKEWCDLLLFCNYKTYVVKSDNAMEKAKAQGGKRVMYTTHHACWDAKNRHGLPDELPLSYDSISQIFAEDPKAEKSKAEPDPEPEPLTPLEQLNIMMADANATDAEVRKVVAKKGKYPEETPISEYPENFITGWVIKYWSKILDMIKEEN